MRRVVIGAAMLALAACSKAPDGGATGPDLGTNATAAIAFNYRYGFALAADDIDDLQETHAAACERVGVERCRITGLHYHVGPSGEVSADLSVALAPPVARRFGRQAIAAAEATGGVLTGADVDGEDAATPAADASAGANEAGGDEARIARELARPGLPAAERAELRAQQVAALERRRTASVEAADLRRSVAITPMTFVYTTGRGTGFANRLRDTADTAAESTTATVGFALRLIAIAGPPALLALVLFLLWRRWGRPLRDRLMQATEPA